MGGFAITNAGTITGTNFEATSTTATNYFLGKVGIGTSTPAGLFVVATGTDPLPSIFVDADTGRVGIGTASPATALDVAGDITIGANKLRTTNMIFRELNATTFVFFNAAEAAYMQLNLGQISFFGSTSFLQGENVDNRAVPFKARENGVGLVEVARMAGAADPYFAMGASQEFKFFTSGGLVNTATTTLANVMMDSATTSDNFHISGDLTITGTTTATGQVIVPTVPYLQNHAASKDYVDSMGAEAIDYFLTDTAAQGSNTFQMFDNDLGGAQSTFSTTSVGAGDTQVFVTFITPPESLPFTTVETGVHGLHFHGQQQSGAKDVTFSWELFASSTVSEALTLIMTSEESSI